MAIQSSNWPEKGDLQHPFEVPLVGPPLCSQHKQIYGHLQHPSIKWPCFMTALLKTSTYFQFLAKLCPYWTNGFLNNCIRLTTMVICLKIIRKKVILWPLWHMVVISRLHYGHMSRPTGNFFSSHPTCNIPVWNTSSLHMQNGEQTSLWVGMVVSLYLCNLSIFKKVI